jgi:hypothetical protein
MQSCVRVSMQQRLATQKCDCCIYTGFIKYLFKWASSSDFSAWFTQVRKQKGRSLALRPTERCLRGARTASDKKVSAVCRRRRRRRI